MTMRKREGIVAVVAILLTATAAAYLVGGFLNRPTSKGVWRYIAVGNTVEGEKDFRRLCIACHSSGVGPSLAPFHRLVRQRDMDLYKRLVDILVGPHTLRQDHMLGIEPSFGLTERQIAGVVRYFVDEWKPK